MALFFIDYDLRNQRSYQPLYDELARFNARRVLESVWCFERINTNAAALRNHFKRFIDHDDGLCVTQVVDWATRNANEEPH
ncbi:MAG: hypothetical protein E6Q88_03930 [Lysobacteraceae bacterium]|nr:MAG: hypothetical protein E6Q88_03930 [Xanthomonadaceae bacterium]